jgi:Cdc6-like AAA superfamily ATPase
MSRLDAVTYISHGVDKNAGDTGSPPSEVEREISKRINRVFKDDLKVISDIVPHTPVLATPIIAEKITELAIDLVEQSAAAASAEVGPRPLITIGIYGPWGSGKSTLLRAVGRRMSDSGFVAVHINTWKWDGNEDIFAFMNRELLRSLSTTHGVKWRAFVIKALLKLRANAKRWGIWAAIAVGALVAALVIDWKSITTTELAKGTLAGVLTTGIIAAVAKPMFSLVEKALLLEPTGIDSRQSLSKSYRYLDLVRRFTRAKRRGPIVFLFDDLDRCDNKVVVDFIR